MSRSVPKDCPKIRKLETFNVYFIRKVFFIKQCGTWKVKHLYGSAWCISVFNPISPGALGPDNTPEEAQSARIQFKGSKLLFCLETLYMLSEI